MNTDMFKLKFQEFLHLEICENLHKEIYVRRRPDTLSESFPLLNSSKHLLRSRHEYENCAINETSVFCHIRTKITLYIKA